MPATNATSALDFLRQMLDNKKSDLAFYTANFAAVDGQVKPFSDSVKIDKDSYFLCTHGMVFAANGATDQTITTYLVPDCNVYLRDTSTGRGLMDVPAILPAYFGAGNFPALWPMPYAFTPGGDIECDLYCLSQAGIPLDVQLVFIGMKVFL
jgi:hypothetical protein